ncbi:MAG: AAA family ATPase [Methanobacteriota archaeon]|nr:MAG: AAA family ATPase [Euryarchaeota archaeon]
MHISHVRLLRDRFPTREHYPFNLAIFTTTESIALSRPVTFFIGENGTGKSTLLRAIAQGCGIYLWEESQRRRFHYNRYENDLHACIELVWTGEKVPGSFFSSETFRYFAEVLDEWAAADPGTLDHVGGESLMEKSHGLRHTAFFASHFRAGGLYFLDEPENALSPKMQIRLLKLFQMIGSIGNAQFIIATHSPILLAYPDAEIFSFDRSSIEKVAYEETDYYRMYKDFLNDYDRYIRKLQE